MANTFLTLENATFLNKDYAFLNSALKALKFSVQLRKKKKINKSETVSRKRKSKDKFKIPSFTFHCCFK